MEITDQHDRNPKRKAGRLGLTSALAGLLMLSALSAHCQSAPGNKTTNNESRTTMTATQPNDPRTTVTYLDGAIVRGPRDKKVIALEFTGGNYADGGTTILKTLAKHDIKASFFFIGDFFRTAEFKPIIEQIRDEGHYLGPHSDEHPLYASWEDPPKLLISREDFHKDIDANMKILENFGVAAKDARYFVPPYEHYTQEIADWTAERDMVLINLTRGTLSHTDYMEDDDPRYRTSETIVKSILDYEAKDPDGLNGFLLLMHIGASPKRTRCHLYNHLDELITELKSRGYSFQRVDELLAPKE